MHFCCRFAPGRAMAPLRELQSPIAICGLCERSLGRLGSVQLSEVLLGYRLCCDCRNFQPYPTLDAFSRDVSLAGFAFHGYVSYVIGFVEAAIQIFYILDDESNGH